MDAALPLFLVVTVVVVTVGTLLHQRKRSRLRRSRGALFDAVTPLFADAVVTQDDVGFPVLTGSLGGYGWRLEPVVDALTYRKLPTLWLCITCYSDIGVTAPVSVLLRPSGNEFFSPNRGYPHELPLPAGCPAHARAAAAEPGVPTASLGRSAELLAEPDTKEILLSRRGVRVVRRLGEADPGRYRVGRRIELGTPVVPADDVARICGLVVASVAERRVVGSS